MVAGSRENIPGSKISNYLGDLGDLVGTSGDPLITELRLGTLGTRLDIYNIIYLQKVPIPFFHHYIHLNRFILQHCMGRGWEHLIVADCILFPLPATILCRTHPIPSELGS